DGAQRLFDGTQNQLDACVLIGVVTLDLGDGSLGTDEGNAAAGNDTFFHCSAGGVQGVFDASLLFLHFDFGGSTDANHGNTASQLGHALLQLLAVVVRGGFLDLDADLLDAGF